MKRTPWYPENVKPVRVGVYERVYSWGIEFSHWDGKGWGSAGKNIRMATTLCRIHVLGNHKWRGLTEKAE